VKSAYECKEEFSSRDGKCLKRERAIGAIVPWSIVALAAIFTGYKLLPPTFWSLFKL
jgi:hypothetical protein